MSYSQEDEEDHSSCPFTFPEAREAFCLAVAIRAGLCGYQCSHLNKGTGSERQASSVMLLLERSTCW